MSLVKDLDRKLNDLWTRRKGAILGLFGRRQGRPHEFSRRVREKRLEEIRELAEAILLKGGARGELDYVLSGETWRKIKGRGLDDRFGRLWQWAQGELKGPLVYSFWRGSRCLYVGKAGSYKRLYGYRRAAYLRDANRLKIQTVYTDRELGKAECLAIHFFKPRDNQVRAAKRKWRSGCPVCAVLRQVDREVRDLFRAR